MGGELSVNVKMVRSDKYFVRPWNDCDISNDLTMVLGDSEFLHICGDNDWAFLALELLEPILNEGKKIVKLITEAKASKPKLRAVVLGKNDKRIMDVYHGGRGKCEKVLGIPILTSERLDEITFLVEEDGELPFY